MSEIVGPFYCAPRTRARDRGASRRVLAYEAGRSAGSPRRPPPGAVRAPYDLLAPPRATKRLARASESKVPASVHQPLRISYVMSPAAM